MLALEVRNADDVRSLIEHLKELLNAIDGKYKK